jgi:hypothetical protein
MRHGQAAADRSADVTDAGPVGSWSSTRRWMSRNAERDWRLCADDIVEACGKIRRFISGMDYDAFIADERTRDAAIRNLEIHRRSRKEPAGRGPEGEEILEGTVGQATAGEVSPPESRKRARVERRL